MLKCLTFKYSNSMQPAKWQEHFLTPLCSKKYCRPGNTRKLSPICLGSANFFLLSRLLVSIQRLPASCQLCLFSSGLFKTKLEKFNHGNWLYHFSIAGKETTPKLSGLEQWCIISLDSEGRFLSLLTHLDSLTWLRVTGGSPGSEG